MELGKWVRLQWDRAAAWLLVVVGGLVLLAGWLGISRTPYPAEQLPYILSGGIAGMFLLGVGTTAWLSADLRDEWRKLDAIDETLRRIADRPPIDAGAFVVDGEAAVSEVGGNRPERRRRSGVGTPVANGSARVPGRSR